MEKVTLTKEQAHEFESFKTLRSSLEEWARDKQDPNAAHSIIHELTFDEMARAYYIGYEIEPEKPEFLPGDDVMVNWSNGRKVHRVKKVEDDGSVTLDRDFSLNSRPNMNIVRHATPEEVYWLKTIGRKKIGDFREGDILMDTERVLFEVGHEVDKDSAGYWVKDGNISGIYPAESFKPFPKDE